MKGPDQNPERRAGASGQPETEVRERMRFLKVGDRSRRANKSQPPEWAGGARRAAAPDAASASSVFVIAKRGAAFLETPVFHAGESGEEEAVALFTGRQQAQHYLDRADWGGTDEVGVLSPGDLLRWLTEASGEGVRYATVNPDQDGHLGGEPQAVLALDGMAGRSPDGVFQEVADLAHG